MSKTIEIETSAETAQKHWEVDVQNIKPLNRAGGNIRVDYGNEDGSFKELVASIEANGIMVPLRAYRDKDNEGGWIAIDGHRRLAAAMVLVEKGMSIRAKLIVIDYRKISDEQMIIDMVVTNSGKPLSPIELSDAVHRLVGHGYKPKEIAIKFGMEAHAVRNLDLLGAAPKRIRDLISSNKLSYTVALDFIKTSVDFNEAVSKIEKAFSISKIEKTIKDKPADFESQDKGEPIIDAPITRRHLDSINNKVDSFLELKKVFKKHIDTPMEIKNQELFAFCKKISENKLISADIINLLFH